jgi:ribosomal protein L22
MSNWEAKNEGQKADEAGLVVKSVQVNEARGLKRMLPAPQGPRVPHEEAQQPREPDRRYRQA